MLWKDTTSTYNQKQDSQLKKHTDWRVDQVKNKPWSHCVVWKSICEATMLGFIFEHSSNHTADVRKVLYYTVLSLWYSSLSALSFTEGGPIVFWILNESPVCTLDVQSQGKELAAQAHTASPGWPGLIRYSFLLGASSFRNPVLCNAMLNKTFPYVHYPELKTRAYQRFNGQSVTERLWASGYSHADVMGCLRWGGRKTVCIHDKDVFTVSV